MKKISACKKCPYRKNLRKIEWGSIKILVIVFSTKNRKVRKVISKVYGVLLFKKFSVSVYLSKDADYYSDFFSPDNRPTLNRSNFNSLHFSVIYFLYG